MFSWLAKVGGVPPAAAGQVKKIIAHPAYQGA